jgi:hypothetical protein
MKTLKTVLIFGLLLMSSCATLIHKRTVGVNIYTDIDSSIVCVKDCNDCYVTPATIDLNRSKKDVILTIQKDTLQRQVILNSKLSTAFWVGNMFSGAGVIGYAIDLTNPKRFTYSKYNYVSLLNENKKLTSQKWIPPVKSQVNFKISIPEGNHFYIKKQNEYGSAFGFLGIAVGLEYFLNDKYSINMDLGSMTDFMLPFPAPVDFEGEYERSFASYGDLQFGCDLKNFYINLGLQFNKTSYYKRETVELFPVYIDTLKYSCNQNNIGLAFSGYYKITNGFNLGLSYLPSVFTWNKKDIDLHYAHLIMVELIFKIQVYRPLKETAGYRIKYTH